MINIDDIRYFLSVRTVDLYIGAPGGDFELCLHARSMGEGDYFRLLAREVYFAELAGNFPLGEIVVTDKFDELGALVPRWARLARGGYEGTALALRSGFSDRWGLDADGSVIIATHFEWRKGRDWDRVLDVTTDWDTR